VVADEDGGLEALGEVGLLHFHERIVIHERVGQSGVVVP
jgi:hypothetical protein